MCTCTGSSRNMHKHGNKDEGRVPSSKGQKSLLPSLDLWFCKEKRKDNIFKNHISRHSIEIVLLEKRKERYLVKK